MKEFADEDFESDVNGSAISKRVTGKFSFFLVLSNDLYCRPVKTQLCFGKNYGVCIAV